MKKLIHALVLSTVVVLTLASCSFFPTGATKKIEPTASLAQLVKLELIVQADTSVPFTAVGQIIKYSYSIKNAGSTGVPAGAPNIMTVTGGAPATCPDANTTGNKDGVLDVNEILVCTSAYSITQDDFNRGSVTNTVTASVYGVSSAPIATTINITKPAVAGAALKLTKTASPANYTQAGQTITYTYVITNTGTTPLGPAQFTVTDPGIPAPINCGGVTTLATTATLTCTSAYTITQTDMSVASISTNATATGGGAPTTEPAGSAVTKGAAVPPANLTPGSTYPHTVSEDEWLWQIARCYGANPDEVLRANPQLGNPAVIKKGDVISVPHIGSAGKIYGMPCVKRYTVQNSDTWSSIAQANNADVTVMQKANANILTVGKSIIIPLNSAGAFSVSTPKPVSGNCTDLTRNLTLVGIPAKVTHFNVCGQTDASGNMKIATIKIYQRPEDVGLGGFGQEITLPAAVITSTPLNDPNNLIVMGDVNYDGNDDFRVMELLPAGPNIPYLYYVYDPATRSFVFNETYRKITSPEFPGNFEIRSKFRESAVKWGIDTYKVTNNIPTLTQKETWEIINTTQAKHVITVFNANGTSQNTVDEVIPIPAH